MDLCFEQIAFGNFIKREKRFFVYIEKNNKFIMEDDLSVAYCPNVGKMSDILIPGSQCLFSAYTGKLKWKWEAVLINNNFIGVNTQNPNILSSRLLKTIWPNENFKSEVSFAGYRADFASNNIIVEVKNVHWKIDNIAYFPDCITERGAKQMLKLAELNHKYQCYVIYILQRNDCDKICVADWIDKTYAKNVLIAKQNGVKFLAFNTNIYENGISINKQIDVI